MSKAVDALLRDVVVVGDVSSEYYNEHPHQASMAATAENLRRSIAEQREHLKSDPRRIYVCRDCGDLTSVIRSDVDASIDYPTPYPAGPSVLRHKSFDIEIRSSCCGSENINVYVLDEDFDPKEVDGT